MDICELRSIFPNPNGEKRKQHKRNRKSFTCDQQEFVGLTFRSKKGKKINVWIVQYSNFAAPLSVCIFALLYIGIMTHIFARSVALLK